MENTPLRIIGKSKRQLIVLFIIFGGMISAGVFLPVFVRSYAEAPKENQSFINNVCLAVSNIINKPSVIADLLQSLWLDSFLNAIPYVVLCCFIMASNLLSSKWSRWRYTLTHGLICVIPLSILSAYIHYKVHISSSSTAAIALFLFPVYGIILVFIYYFLSLSACWFVDIKRRGETKASGRKAA